MFTNLYPLLQVTDLGASARFYCDHLGFTIIFESDWYMQLRAPHSEHELALIAYDHDSIPRIGQKVTSGLILSFEVNDAAAQAQRFAQLGLPIVQPLRDEPFGQRHFIASDPDGILLDVITPIDPDPDWLAGNGG